MSIEFGTKKNTNTTGNKEELGFQIIFYALNLLAVPFSAIATYNGYRETAGGAYMALVLAALTGVLFFGMNYIIMNRRKNGQPHLVQTLGYILPLAISFIGNFTYFYGNQIEGSSLKEDLSKYSQTLDATFQSSIAALDNSTGLDELSINYKAGLVKLKFQFEIPPKGYGKEAQKAWAEIYDIFNMYNSKYNNSASSKMPTVLVTTYPNFEAAANNYFNSLKSSKELEINKIKEPIKDIYIPLSIQANDLLKDENEALLKKDGQNLIKDIISANKTIGEKTKGKIRDFIYEPLSASYNKVSSQNPIQALESAISFKEPVATISAAFFSLVIDLITLAFIFLAIPYTKNTRRRINSGRTL